MPRLVGINHVAVDVGDIDQALEFSGGSSTSPSEARAHAWHSWTWETNSSRSRQEHATRRHTRHIGLVVDDRAETLAAAALAGARIAGDNDFLDPWGNRWQVVDYRDVQFTKTPRILEGMGLSGLEKTERALDELRAKGLADQARDVKNSFQNEMSSLWL